MEITISNKNLEVRISTKGAELQSVIKDGKSYLWDGNPEQWEDKAPILFPICGTLKEDRFEYEGKSYSLTSHGFAKDSEFEVESAQKESVTFLLKSSDETKKIYPFHFEFRVKYTLLENSIKVDYIVNNTDNKEIYASVGGHEGYICPEGIEEYIIEFDKEEDINSNFIEAPLLVEGATPIAKNVKELSLKNEYFEIDALILLDLKTRAITLKNKKGDRKIRVDFSGHDYLLVWSMPNANFVCIEPWAGLPDYVGTSFDITKKRGINKIGVGKALEKTHTITFS